jgi:hypothetical protein
MLAVESEVSACCRHAQQCCTPPKQSLTAVDAELACSLLQGMQHHVCTLVFLPQ